jgi:RNA polymerase sigma-70 factor (ECF subfamily)
LPVRPDLQDIIHGCIKANRDSQKHFYEMFYGYAIGICMRYTSNDDDALEIVNDGFLKLYKALPAFSPQHANVEASLKGWMKRIMINTAIDHLRKYKQRFLVAELADSQFNTADETESSIDHMTYKEILAVIQRLSPVYRIVFNLYVLDGFKHEEIARQLNISVGASKSNLAKARMNIQKMLKESDFNFYEQKAV